MHAVAAFFASIITFVSGFFAPTVASNSPVNVRMMQPAAAAAAQTDITGDPFNDAAAASAVAAALAAAPSSAVSPPPAQTVINQPVIERIIERVVPQGGTISASALTAILADFEQSISNRIATLNPPPAAIPAQVAAGGNAGGYGFFPASQRIDQLTKTAINSPTITGGTISGASVSGYLPLSGGTLTGALSGTDLSLSGNLTAGTLSVAGLSSSGALFAPYFSATSTTATSTFAGGLTAASLAFNILQNGNVGIGTTSPNYTLDVNGNINIPFNTDIKAGGIQWMHLSSSQTARLYGTTYQLLTGAVRTLRQQVDSSGNFDFNSGQMYIQQSTGNVGIGTLTPGGKLSVNGGVGIGGAGYSDTSQSTGDLSMSGKLAVGVTGGTAKATIAGNLYVNSAETDTVFSGTVGATNATLIGPSAYWAIRAATNHSYNLDVYNSGAPLAAMTVLQSGNVGIGTTSPANPLHIVGSTPLRLDSSTDGGSLLLLRGTGAITQQNIAAQFEDTASVAKSFAQIRFLPTDRTAGSEDADLAFFLRNAGSLNEAVRITGTGNVGIGTTSPTNKLEVGGNTFLGGTITGTSTLALTGTTGTTTIAAGQGFTIGTSQFVLQQGSGNVGIGTTTPQNLLSVYGGSSNAFVDINSLNGQTGFHLQRDGATKFNIYNQPVSASSYYLALHSANTGTGLDIDYTTGNVGIGTTTPGFPLVVQGNIEQWIDAATNWRTVQRNTSQIGLLGNRSNYFFNFDTAQQRVAVGADLDFGSLFNVAGSASIGSTYDATAAPTNGLIVEGNVGIGNTNPSEKLNVQGTAAFQLFNATSTTGTSTIAAGQGFTIGGSQFVLQQGSGNVGVGITNPGGQLHVSKGPLTLTQPVNGNADEFVVQDDASAGISILSPNNETGWLIFGDTDDSSQGMISYDHGTALSDVADTMEFWTNGTRRLAITSAGNIGIGTTSPTAQLHTTGTVRFSNFGAGTLTTDASGNLSVSSDERLKNIQSAFEPGLAAIMQVDPIRYRWKPETGYDASTTYAGFSAQNIQTAIPEAVGASPNGYLSLSDRPILAALVNAVKELAQQFGAFAERITTKELVANNGTVDTLTVRQKLCVATSDGTPVCWTGDQIAAVLAATGQSAVSPSPAIPSSTPQAPVIELNGNATSAIEVGDTYSDLGARIIAPDSDLNLGIVTLLDGATTTAVSIDTSTPGEHTILYTVTSPTTGLTGSIMRTVIVAPTTQSPEPPPNDNPFNLVPANDNATSTPVTSWM